MKMKFAKLAFALIAMVMSFGVKANVFTQEVHGVVWSYTVTDGMVTVGEGVLGKTAIDRGTSGGITIPSSLGGYPVVDIALRAFQGCRYITSVAISDSVTNISSAAFSSCDSLQYVYIGKGVENIASGPFRYCRSLVSFGVHPENRRCSAINGVLLFNLTDPESPNPRYRLVAGVGGDVVIPYGVVSIPSDAFSNITNLTSVVVPSSVEIFSGQPSFGKCMNLKHIYFQGNAPTSEFSFDHTNCTVYVNKGSLGWGVEIPGTWNRLKIEYIDPGVEYAPASDFEYSTNSGYVVINRYVGADSFVKIPPSIDDLPVRYVNTGTFSGNKSILEVVIPEGVEECHFADCPNLVRVTIPDSLVTPIGDMGQSANCRIQEIRIKGISTRYCMDRGIVYSIDGKKLIACPSGLANIAIRSDISAIERYAFKNSLLDRINIPNGVTSIGAYAFDSCASLSRIVFEGNAPTVGNYAFYHTASNCTAYVKRDSTGWGVDIPGTWNGIKIAYLEEDDVVATRCEVTAVAVKPRWPWNGIVDIDFTLTIEPAGAKAMVSVVGYDTVKNVAIHPRLPGAEEPISAGNHRFIWDIGAEYPQFHSEAFTVDVTAVPVTNQTQEAGLYMVIDLSGGTNAAAYPVSYLSAAPSGGWTDEHKTTKLVMRRIEPGTFVMNDKYNVTLTKPFYMGVYEVTQKQYELVTGSNPSSYKGDARPVEYVSWNTIRGNSDIYNWPSNRTVDAASFMGIIQQKTGLGLDLPTEAQWEYACRAGTTSAYNNGGSTTNDLNVLGRYVNNQNDGKGGYSQHTTVGSYLPNAWGLYDLHGNVFEWCLDWYGSLSNGMDPVGSASEWYRVMRGGGWGIIAIGCSSSHRGCAYPSSYNNSYGFRLACSAER